MYFLTPALAKKSEPSFDLQCTSRVGRVSRDQRQVHSFPKGTRGVHRGPKMTYAEKLKHPKWQQKRLKILARDKFICRACGNKDKTLHVHHCFYEKGDPWETADKYLITLCVDCHKRRQGDENLIKRGLGFLYARLDNDDLSNLCQSVLNISASPDCSPELWDSFEVEWRSDIRWWNRAVENKSMRIHYEAVTGETRSWKKKTVIER